MILDSIHNRAFYKYLGSGIADALEYLAKTDFSKMPDGKYELDGQRMFAIVQHYRPKPLDEIVWEAHRKYIDVQYVARGTERMGYVALGEGLSVKQPYDPNRDAAFYDVDGNLFTISQGSFAVFAPGDVHAPGLATASPTSAGEVLKVVVKCLVEED
jgi:biofilm protein TabA